MSVRARTQFRCHAAEICWLVVYDGEGLSRGVVVRRMASTGHLAAQSPQPVQRAGSCTTERFFQSLVSNAIRRSAHAEMQRPQPVQRAGSM